MIRQVQIPCKEGRIEGKTRMSRIWVVTESAEKPTIDKNKAERNNR